MAHGRWGLVAAVLLAGGASEAAVARVLGVEVRSGDRFTADLQDSADIDTYVIDLTAGGIVSATVKGAKGGPDSLFLQLVSPDEVPVPPGKSLKGAGSRKVRLSGVSIPTTGRWAIEVSSPDGALGVYTIIVKARHARKAKIPNDFVPADGTLLCPFPGTNGAKISVKVVELSDPPLQSVRLLDPAGDPLPVVVSNRGRAWSVRRQSLSGEFGEYAVEMTGGSAGMTEVRCKVTVSYLKVRKRRIRLPPEPVPLSVSPMVGVAGTSVTIEGTGFRQGAIAYFGSYPSVDCVLDEEGRLLCSTPAGVGTAEDVVVDLAVQNGDGQAGGLDGPFTYLAIPAPQEVTPALGPLAGGISLTVTGSHLRSGAGVEVGGTPASNVVVTPETTVSCDTPPHEAGSVGVVVIDEYGRRSSLVPGHTYVSAPTVTAVEPLSGTYRGDTFLTVHGVGFRTGATVTVGGAAASAVSVLSPDRLTCLTPAHAEGPADVVVLDEFGQASPPHTGFTYAGPVSVTGVTPPSCPIFGGVPAVVHGNNFKLDDDIYLGGSPLASTPVTESTVVVGHAVTLPAHAVGKVSVEVRNESNDESSTLQDAISYYAFIDATSSSIPSASSTDDWGGVATVAIDGNGDGAIDSLVIAHLDKLSSTRPGTRVLKNDGAGVFTDATSSAMPVPTTSESWGANQVAWSDLNGDGHPDLYLSRPGMGIAWDKPPADGNTDWYEARLVTPTNKYVDPWGALFFGDSDGKFTAQAVTGANGLLQIGGILVCNATWACAGESRQQGTVCKLYDFDFRSTYCRMGDLDGDLDQDIVLLNDHSLADFTGTSIGTWVSCYGYSTVDYQYYTANPDGSCLRILTTGSNGGLTDRTQDFLTDAPSADENFRGVSAFVADMDGDFLRDIVIVHNNDITAGSTRLSAARLFLQKNSGSAVTFSQNKSFFPAPLVAGDDDWRGNAIAAGDLNGDGLLDIVVCLDDAPPGDSGLSTRLLLQDPDTESLVDTTADVLDGLLPATDDGRAGALVLADMDGDGDLDILIGTTGNTGTGNRKTRLLLNVRADSGNGNPEFIDGSDLLPPIGTDTGSTLALQVGDIDGDGATDIILTDAHQPEGTPVRRTRIWRQVR